MGNLLLTSCAAFAALTIGCIPNSPPAPPGGFLWGVSLSAHQTEGITGGGEKSDWYTFEHSSTQGKPNIRNGENADLAADHWNRYKDDLRLAKDLGINSLRTSIAWEKVEPTQGVFNPASLKHYRDVLIEMHRLGIRPVLVLHHTSQPQWFADLGGWLNPAAPFLFLEYATQIVDSLGDLCDLWIPFNEPLVFVSMGYLNGSVPPGISSLDSENEALFQVARAHRLVAAMIHQKQGLSPGARGPGEKDGALRGVGIAESVQAFDPWDPKNPKDQMIAESISETSNWTFIRAMVSGKLAIQNPAGSAGTPTHYREFPVSDISADAGPALDWIGLNYYTQWLMKYDPTNSMLTQWLMSPTLSRNDGLDGQPGWVIYPEGLEKVLRQADERFHLPLVVTENGTADRADTHRAAFIHDHLAALDRAIHGSKNGPPLDVRGYFHWTLMDDFEWSNGLDAYKMGLYEIRFDDNLKRVARPSAWVYHDEIQARSKNDNLKSLR